MRVVAGQLILEPELFLLELMEKIFVRVRSMLFLVDERVKRLVT